MSVASGSAAVALAETAKAQGSTDLVPPAEGRDAYGLDGALGQANYFDRVLRGLGEPAILTENAKIIGATFRLTEDYSLRRPRAARIIFLEEAEPRAVSIIKDYGTQTATNAKPIAVLRYFDGQAATRLRLLIDDRERFWDASPVPPDWWAIACQARNGNRPCPPATDGGTSLLEGRIGPKKHAILRHNPDSTSLVQQLVRDVF
ncbi:hypothetical protein [Sphingomonas sp. BK580]|uniref:hypothetical protein n=1 Tax=Sphingomonas sp. BK580 TaxID=2586972 RepID=UPI00161F670E|nr:hypothetical protein [Sphingomonas sp. BK580]MBB3692670.1 hypothetical protein [Sphingomonas sp. BK580]